MQRGDPQSGLQTNRRLINGAGTREVVACGKKEASYSLIGHPPLQSKPLVHARQCGGIETMCNKNKNIINGASIRDLVLTSYEGLRPQQYYQCESTHGPCAIICLILLSLITMGTSSLTEIA